jgi:hypothetical protein
VKTIRQIFEYNVCGTVIIDELPYITAFEAQWTEAFYIRVIAIGLIADCYPYTGKFIVTAVEVEYMTYFLDFLL